MFKFLNYVLIIFLLLQASCSNNKDNEISILKEGDIEMQMIDAYREGVRILTEEGDGLYAAKKFNEAELLFPQSTWAPKSSLMAAYSYYSQQYYSDAIFELERFLKIYPKNKEIGYAHYMLAMCYYESIVDEKKDLKPLLKAQEKFIFIIKNYPNTDYSLDSRFKLDLIKDVLASKEIYIGRHYVKKEKWIAAINRFKYVVDIYDTTIYVEEALHRLVEIYYKIGLVEESNKYANLLGYNYQSGSWYKETYKIFNRKYKTKKIKKDKKKKNLLIKKFKSLFD
jgi:outer membrane protein assembly factor BamD